MQVYESISLLCILYLKKMKEIIDYFSLLSNAISINQWMIPEVAKL